MAALGVSPGLHHGAWLQQGAVHVMACESLDQGLDVLLRMRCCGEQRHKDQQATPGRCACAQARAQARLAHVHKHKLHCKANMVPHGVTEQQLEFTAVRQQPPSS